MLPTRCLLLTSCLLLPACAEGEPEDLPISEVQVSAAHFVYGLGGRQLITDFPIPTAAVGAFEGFFNMTDDGSYTIKEVGQVASSAVSYQLAEDGSLALVVPISGRAPTRYIGAYHQAAAGDLTQTYFFTDRYAPQDLPVVGFFWGTRTTAAHDMSKARGDWHLFSSHILFSSSSSPNPNSVGRAFFGSLTVAEDPGKPDKLTGTGFDSSGPNSITLTGTASAKDTIGEIDFSLLYNADTRILSASQGKEIILGLDRDKTDGESGLFAMVKKFRFGNLDPINNPKDPDAELAKAKTSLKGRWHFGLHTIFVAPSTSGIDAANGTLTMGDDGTFKFEGIGSKGPGDGEFSFTGTYEYQVITVGKVWENLLKFNIAAAGSHGAETWWAAVDSTYNNLVFVDITVEGRTAGSAELNMGLAIKEILPN